MSASSRSGTAKDVMWYVLEVKRYVKWTYEAWTFRGRRVFWWGWELLDYELH